MISRIIYWELCSPIRSKAASYSGASFSFSKGPVHESAYNKRKFKYILKKPRGIWKYRITFLFEVTSHRQHIQAKTLDWGHCCEASALALLCDLLHPATHTHTHCQHLWERLVAGLNDYLADPASINPALQKVSGYYKQKEAPPALNYAVFRF